MLIKTMSCLLSQANLPAFSNQFTTIYPHILFLLILCATYGGHGIFKLTNQILRIL